MLLGARQFFEVRNAPEPVKVLRFRSGIDARSNVAFPNGDFTLCFWMKCYGLAGASDLFAFGWADGGWGGTRLMVSASRIYVRYATGSSASQYDIYGHGSIVSDEQWHHYVIKLDGSSLTASIDDSQILSKTISGSHQSDSIPFSIGSIGNDSNINARRGDKAIGFFCLFSRALSASEITDVRNSRKIDAGASLYSDLVCGYELSNTTEMSNATGSNNLTLHNAYGAEVEYADELPNGV